MLICIKLISVTGKSYEGTKDIFIQATDSNVTLQLLTQSKKIISERLRIYGLEPSDIEILADKGQLKIQCPQHIKVSEINGLLTYKGELAFYETYNRKEIADLLKNNNQLFDLLKNTPETNPSDSKIGCLAPENCDRVNEYLLLNRPDINCKFVWGMKSHKSLICLYALKTKTEGQPLLIRSDVETIKSSQDKKSQSFMIEMKFNQAATRIWANATRDNLNRSIAIVLDNSVFYDPVVKTAMENGLCEITGNLTIKDVNYFLALVNNDQLPLSFNLLR